MANNDISLDHIKDVAVKASKSGQVAYTFFISPAQATMLKSIAYKNNCFYKNFGGYDFAERTIAAFYDDYSEPHLLDFPIGCLKITPAPNNPLPTHRQIMGTILSQGLKRDVLGDIVVMDNVAYVFCSSNMLNYVYNNLGKIGNISVNLEIMESLPELGKKTGTEKRITVSSPRLDAILSSALNLSRSKAALLVSQGMVSLNHIEEKRPDVKIDIGDMLSVRGHGRVIVNAIGSPTKKNRLPVELELFTSK